MPPMATADGFEFIDHGSHFTQRLYNIAPPPTARPYIITVRPVRQTSLRHVAGGACHRGSGGESFAIAFRDRDGAASETLPRSARGPTRCGQGKVDYSLPRLIRQKLEHSLLPLTGDGVNALIARVRFISGGYGDGRILFAAQAQLLPHPERRAA